MIQLTQSKWAKIKVLKDIKKSSEDIHVMDAWIYWNSLTSLRNFTTMKIIIFEMETTLCTCTFKLDTLRFFMMFEFCASAGRGISKEIASKEISLFNSFISMSGKFKYHKKLENVNFEDTNNAVSILVINTFWFFLDVCHEKIFKFLTT